MRSDKNVLIRNMLSLSFLVMVLALIWLYFVRNPVDITKLSDFSLSMILVLGLLSMLNVLIYGQQINVLLKFYGIKLKFMEWFGLTSVSTLGNYLIPFRGGAYIRAVYLKKKHGFSYSSFMVTLAATSILFFIVIGLLGVIVSFLSWWLYGIFNILIFGIFAVLFIAPLAGILILPDIKKTRNKFINFFIRLSNEWKKLSSDKKLVFNVMCLNVIYLFVMAFKFYLIFIALGMRFSFLLCLSVALLSFATDIFSITPANLGIRDAAIVFSSNLLGADLNLSILVAAIDRIVNIITVFILGSVFSLFMVRKR